MDTREVGDRPGLGQRPGGWSVSGGGGHGHGDSEPGGCDRWPGAAVVRAGRPLGLRPSEPGFDLGRQRRGKVRSRVRHRDGRRTGSGRPVPRTRRRWPRCQAEGRPTRRCSAAERAAHGSSRRRLTGWPVRGGSGRAATSAEEQGSAGCGGRSVMTASQPAAVAAGRRGWRWAGTGPERARPSSFRPGPGAGWCLTDGGGTTPAPGPRQLPIGRFRPDLERIPGTFPNMAGHPGGRVTNCLLTGTFGHRRRARVRAGSGAPRGATADREGPGDPASQVDHRAGVPRPARPPVAHPPPARLAWWAVSSGRGDGHRHRLPPARPCARSRSLTASPEEFPHARSHAHR